MLHSADACIGCQYCTWNCSYGVPQYNAERGVVGKCDMCHNRLADGRAPACVNACPEEAIQVEIVNIAEWRADYSAANAPGLPSADDSISTTRITLPEKADARVRARRPPSHAARGSALAAGVHAGAHAAFGGRLPVSVARAAGRAATRRHRVAGAWPACRLGASTLHLGRPIYAWRALKMWRRSWLSREVLLFSLFAGGGGYASAAVPGRLAAAWPLFWGSRGVTASAFIYLVPARPAWNRRYTLADFYLTGLLLGPLFLGLIGNRCSGGGGRGGRRARNCSINC